MRHRRARRRQILLGSVMVLLGLAGYVSGGQAQPASALAAIPLLFATGPALMLACSAPLLFKLDRLRRRQGQPL